MEKYKLKICLIPSPAFGQKMLNVMGKKEWSKLSSYVRSGCVCAGCGAKKDKRRLDAHEEWEFKNGEQRLKAIVPLCKRCHESVHPGRANIIGRLQEAIEWFIVVRKISIEKYINEYNKAADKWEKQSKKEWKLATTPEEAWEIAKKFVEGE